jgi:hypothetical protein
MLLSMLFISFFWGVKDCLITRKFLIRKVIVLALKKKCIENEFNSIKTIYLDCLSVVIGWGVMLVKCVQNH